MLQDVNTRAKSNRKEGLKVINAIRIFMTLVLLIMFDYSIGIIESGSLPTINLTSASFLLRVSMMFVLAFIISKIYDGRTVIE